MCQPVGQASSSEFSHASQVSAHFNSSLQHPITSHRIGSHRITSPHLASPYLTSPHISSLFIPILGLVCSDTEGISHLTKAKCEFRSAVFMLPCYLSVTIINSHFRLVGMKAAMAYIERAITGIIRQRVSASKCLLLTGARQVGKSTLIRHVFPQFNRVNFDDCLTRLQAREEPKLSSLTTPGPSLLMRSRKSAASSKRSSRLRMIQMSGAILFCQDPRNWN